MASRPPPTPPAAPPYVPPTAGKANKFAVSYCETLGKPNAERRNRDAGVEVDLRERPAGITAHRIGKRRGVVVREGVAEGVLHGVEEALAVNERDGALARGFRRHAPFRPLGLGGLPGPKIQNPAGGPKADPTGSRCQQRSLGAA